MATRGRQAPAINPFRPGYGSPPPLMAGREREKSELHERLDGLVARATSLRGLAMFGPRGMGKTVLLNWFEKECTARKITVISTTPTQALSSRSALADVLFPRRLGITELGVSLTRFALNIGFRAGASHNLGKKIAGICNKRPMALLMDEAHVISEEDATLCRSFLQACQQAAVKSPFLLALVGTPGLPAALRSLKATFIERGKSLAIDLLAPDAAAAAIREPLAADGIQIDDAALQFIVEDSQRYPFFLQLWGKALWDFAKARGLKSLGTEDAQRAQPAVNEERAAMYEGRYNEFRRDRHLRTAAHAVAEAFADHTTLDPDDLARRVDESLLPSLPDANDRERKTQALCQELAQLGFVWQPPGQPDIQPGIPSLMDYLRTKPHPP